jgi:integrase
MPLTATAVKNAKPKDKPYKLADQGGLFLLVQPTGGKLWRWKYRLHGKEKLLSIGPAKKFSLAQAREAVKAARDLVQQDIDPSRKKKLDKIAFQEAAGNSFRAVALEWHSKQVGVWSEAHSARVLTRLKNDLFPWLGDSPISLITPPELLDTVRRIENRGALDTAHRALQNAGQIFRYAIATGRAETDPSRDLRDALPPVRPKHHASVTDPKRVGALMRAIDGLGATFVVQSALNLLPLVFVRQGELRTAQWGEIDLEAAEWRIPAHKMKMRVMHIVPLSTQAVEILRQLKPLTDRGEESYLFPSIRGARRPMSENTINAALRRLGYSKDEMTGHGFRSMASTILHESGWESDAIERQLAHSQKNKVKASYNYAEHLPRRREMMQWWADHLGGLKNQGKQS